MDWDKAWKSFDSKSKGNRPGGPSQPPNSKQKDPAVRPSCTIPTTPATPLPTLYFQRLPVAHPPASAMHTSSARDSCAGVFYAIIQEKEEEGTLCTRPLTPLSALAPLAD